MIGRTLGHYQITEKIGAGGMGVVYKARDLDRFVALKILPPEKVADPDRKRRFVQEAKAASGLNHPNIVHVYDIDQSEGSVASRFCRCRVARRVKLLSSARLALHRWTGQPMAGGSLLGASPVCCFL
jgi:serine/threonine protein kinase